MNIHKFFLNLKSNEKIQFIIEVYDILVELGAIEKMRTAFTQYLLDKDYSKEWRFQGKLGYGGKYYFPENRVDCYSEDFDEKTQILIEEANKKLRLLVS